MVLGLLKVEDLRARAVGGGARELHAPPQLLYLLLDDLRGELHFRRGQPPVDERLLSLQPFPGFRRERGVVFQLRVEFLGLEKLVDPLPLLGDVPAVEKEISPLRRLVDFEGGACHHLLGIDFLVIAERAIELLFHVLVVLFRFPPEKFEVPQFHDDGPVFLVVFRDPAGEGVVRVRELPAFVVDVVACFDITRLSFFIHPMGIVLFCRQPVRVAHQPVPLDVRHLVRAVIDEGELGRAFLPVVLPEHKSS